MAVPCRGREGEVVCARAWSWPRRGSLTAWRRGKAGPCQAMAVASVGASAVFTSPKKLIL